MEGENPSLTPEPGTLYVVATPIGNLADLTERARSILEKASLIACEDTRTTGSLLSKIGIKNRLQSYHDNNERQAAVRIADALVAGESVALVSDAGTPAISDPGFRLTRECHKRDLPVVPVPGPSAASALLSASGLPSDGYLFVGFLPPKSAARRRFLEAHIDFPYSITLYESCHRIEKFVAEMLDILGEDRCICLGRELTKKFETITTGTIGAISESFKSSSKKGEFTIVIAPRKFSL